MITLYGSGPNFGLPDASPFVTKAEVLLKMAGVPFVKGAWTPMKAPKGKMPFIDDDGVIVSDSTFIRWHLESRYGVDFERGLSEEQRAIGWAFEKMVEDHLYFITMYFRWLIDDNFRKGPANLFKAAPAPLRPLIAAMIRRRVRKALHGQGMGRHSAEEAARIGMRAVEAVSTFLDGKRFFFGDEPKGVDAVIFAFTASVLCPLFDTELQRRAAQLPNLRSYVGRMTARFYPDWREIAGCPPEP